LIGSGYGLEGAVLKGPQLLVLPLEEIEDREPALTEAGLGREGREMVLSRFLHRSVAKAAGVSGRG
jgi:hypothetical protein